jgi:hypothetical protein
MNIFLLKGLMGSGRLFQPAVAVAAVILLALVPVKPAQALDLFTLWQQPEIPLQMTEGTWVDYRGQTMSGGRSKVSLTRIACLSMDDGSDNESWILEIYPLIEQRDGTLVAEPGQGVRLRLSRDVLAREGSLMDGVTHVQQWQNGVKTELSKDEWRNDPLVSVSLSGSFSPQTVETGSPTTRFISGRQLLCDPFVYTEADTQSVVLPAGKMTQTRSHVITASVNSEIPFLGLAYITEKVTAESKMSPPNKRFSDPMPSITVEIMELVGYGAKVRSVFSEGN